VPERPTQERSATAEECLSRALSDAPDGGISVSALMKITGMSRRTLYRRLTDYVRTGRAVQVHRGHYRAARSQTGDGA
jgi:hypothetical protein